MNKIVFPLKGERDYVHGTSLFDEVERVSGLQSDGAEVDISFRKMIHNPSCTLEIRPAKTDDSVIARIVKDSGEVLTICVNSSNEIVESVRIEYNEALICKYAKVDGSKIKSSLPNGFSNIEVVVALCKELHNAYIGNECKWIFSRFKGRMPLILERNIDLRIIKTVGTRLTCSEIFSAGNKVGEIYFSS